MSRVLDLYLIAAGKDQYVLFSPTDAIEAVEADSDDRVRQSVDWLMRRRNRLIAWIGRVLQVGHTYYEKLEDRIDPLERVLKAMACTTRLTVNVSPIRNGGDARSKFQLTVRRQRRKHIFWISVDTLVCLIVAIFTPVLAPLPGPNLFFYYPFLRWLSHYRALRGCRSALRFSTVEFKSLPDLGALEENLQSRSDREAIRVFAEQLEMRGLAKFLERVV